MIISPVCLFLFGSFFNAFEQLAALLNTFLQNVCERKAWSEGLGYRLYIYQQRLTKLDLSSGGISVSKRGKEKCSCLFH